MPDAASRPLLSICIPTCNRAHFLEVMLQALLPQVRDCGHCVEVWVLDNSSTDDTSRVLQTARQLGPFQVRRHPRNIGPLRNIIYGPLNLAAGEFVWVLGDHNLLRPGGLARVLDCLRSHAEIDAFYVNFRTATWPQHWPSSAVSGHDGDFDLVANPESGHGRKDKWSELLQSGSSIGTQSYAHVVRTRYWRDFWRNRYIGRDYTSAETTYPHTVTIANFCLHRPAFFIGVPVLTIFNGAQSWSQISTRMAVFFAGLPDLLRTLRRLGLDSEKVRDFRDQFLLANAFGVLKSAFMQLGVWGTMKLALRTCGLRWQSWSTLGLCLIKSTPRVSINFGSSYLYNFRLARWIRSR